MGVPHSRDAAFEEAGLDNDAAMHATGRRYRDTILAQGGSREPMANCRDFRGREPTTDALLRHSGLVAASISSWRCRALDCFRPWLNLRQRFH